MALNAKQGISSKDICDQKLIQKKNAKSLLYQIKNVQKGGTMYGSCASGSL